MDSMVHLVAFFSTFTALFAIVDPFAVIPIFLSMTDRSTQAERLQICKKSTILATGILIAFALAGERIFKLFGISIPAFQIAGGILLLLLGIAQLEAEREHIKSEEENESFEREDISIFPMATPLLAGPGAISTVVLGASSSSGIIGTFAQVMAIICVFICCYFLLRSAPYMHRLLGRTGLNLVTRLMGIVLTAIGIQYIIDGASTVWKQLH